MQSHDHNRSTEALDYHATQLLYSIYCYRFYISRFPFYWYTLSIKAFYFVSHFCRECPWEDSVYHKRESLSNVPRAAPSGSHYGTDMRQLWRRHVDTRQTEGETEHGNAPLIKMDWVVVGCYLEDTRSCMQEFVEIDLLAGLHERQTKIQKYWVSVCKMIDSKAFISISAWYFSKD